ncbi:hypothetical protein TrVE_jg2091 [Triparma verrucosa]|uniref:Proteasome assembly chaperone 3 n=1 Tax=Triparma verrucosa TaxID=1606542 RepID=A0A9W7FB37_9STRA|nr:hypothetical protein TrVE_jg2091 [Triparma verrucosa]
MLPPFSTSTLSISDAAYDAAYDAAIPISTTVHLFPDRTLITISQLPAFGTILVSSITHSASSNKSTYNVTVLLGRRDDDILSVYCRQIIEKVSTFDDSVKSGKPIMFMIGLKEEGKSRGAFVEISNEVLRLYHGLKRD